MEFYLLRFFLDLLDLPEDKTTFISPASALTHQLCCDRNTSQVPHRQLSRLSCNRITRCSLGHYQNVFVNLEKNAAIPNEPIT